MVGDVEVQELIFRLTADTAQFLKNTQETMTIVETMKTKLRELAATSKLSFKDLGAGMITDIKGMNLGDLQKIFPTNPKSSYI